MLKITWSLDLFFIGTLVKKIPYKFKITSILCLIIDSHNQKLNTTLLKNLLKHNVWKNAKIATVFIIFWRKFLSIAQVEVTVLRMFLIFKLIISIDCRGN